MQPTHFARPPHASLRAFVRQLWSAQADATTPPSAARREHVLPTGAVHLVFRLDASTQRIAQATSKGFGNAAQKLGRAVVGGARSCFYAKETVGSTHSVGALLQPGVGALLFGINAVALAERHTDLADLLGAQTAADMHEQLCAAHNAAQRVLLLERFLVALLAKRQQALHPAVVHAIECFDRPFDLRATAILRPVAAAVRDSGYSHRHFNVLFRNAVGLTPGAYHRVARFQSVVRTLHTSADLNLAMIAAHAGYSDQAHLSREFRAIAGVTPTRYRHIASQFPNHVPLHDE